MIVRINQFDPAGAEALGGWEQRGFSGGLEHAWPTDSHAYELLILEQDEKQRPLNPSFRQGQIRRLIPELVLALLEPKMRVVLRFDGPLVGEELLATFHHLCDLHGLGRFAVSESQKFDDDPAVITGSVRIAPSTRRLGEILADEHIGLERQTRLRIFCLPEAMVNPLLDASSTDDERWGELLDNCDFMISTVRGLQSVQVLSERITPDEAKERLTQRLLGAAVASSPR